MNSPFLKLYGSMFALAMTTTTALGHAGDSLALEEVVVTATAEPLTRLRSSMAVSVLDPERMQESSPTNAADILRNVPGVFAQASGGEGNANVTTRGLPISGGAKFTQFQEDGLPVLDFGDIEFATADTFVRSDYNVARLEVVRGGSAAAWGAQRRRKCALRHRQRLRNVFGCQRHDDIRCQQ